MYAGALLLSVTLLLSLLRVMVDVVHVAGVVPAQYEWGDVNLGPDARGVLDHARGRVDAVGARPLVLDLVHGPHAGQDLRRASALAHRPIHGVCVVEYKVNRNLNKLGRARCN